MKAALVAFTPAAPHDERAKRAEQTYRAAYKVIEEQAREAGWPIHGSSPLFRLFITGRQMAELWERRAAKLTKQLQAALALDAFTDDQRAAIVQGLTGSTRRDAKLLTAPEREHLDAFRELDEPDRVAVRRIIRAMAKQATGEVNRPKGVRA